MDKEAPVFDESGSIINEAVFICWHEFMASFIDVTPSNLRSHPQVLSLKAIFVLALKIIGCTFLNQ